MSDLVASTSGPHIKVRVDIPEPLPAAHADANQLEMALLNLSVNARDAMPAGGTLTLAAVAEPIPKGHETGLSAGDYIRLSVSDTGIGMDEETRARAIEPFFSTKGVGKGTGLGLSMVHGLASQLGGALTLASKPGLGTTISLLLPTTSAQAKIQTAGTERSGATRSGTVLLVDDEEAVRATTRELLESLGYIVCEAASGEEAWAEVGRNRFDMVITDHLMPGLSGTDLARRIREFDPDLPVLIISGYAELEGISPDLPRLEKPFRLDGLAASIAALSRRLLPEPLDG